METQYHREGDRLIVAPSGKLDTLNAPQFLKLLQELLAEKPAACLLDLSKVTFLSSSGLQSLLGAAKISKKEEIRFAVCCMQAMVKDVFSLSGFDRFIESYPSKQEAEAALK